MKKLMIALVVVSLLLLVTVSMSQAAPPGCGPVKYGYYHGYCNPYANYGYRYDNYRSHYNYRAYYYPHSYYPSNNYRRVYYNPQPYYRTYSYSHYRSPCYGWCYRR